MYNIIPRDNSMEEDAQTGEVGHGHPMEMLLELYPRT